MVLQRRILIIMRLSEHRCKTSEFAFHVTAQLQNGIKASCVRDVTSRFLPSMPQRKARLLQYSEAPLYIHWIPKQRIQTAYSASQATVLCAIAWSSVK